MTQHNWPAQIRTRTWQGLVLLLSFFSLVPRLPTNISILLIDFLKIEALNKIVVAQLGSSGPYDETFD